MTWRASLAEVTARSRRAPPGRRVPARRARLRPSGSARAARSGDASGVGEITAVGLALVWAFGSPSPAANHPIASPATASSTVAVASMATVPGLNPRGRCGVNGAVCAHGSVMMVSSFGYARRTLRRNESKPFTRTALALLYARVMSLQGPGTRLGLSSVAVAAGVAAAAGAAQLGIGYGLGVFSWVPTVTAATRPHGWRVWPGRCGFPPVGGARCRGGRRVGQPTVQSSTAARVLRRAALSIAAALGGLVVVALTAVPARVAERADTFAPHLIVGGYAIAGVLLGLFVSVAALVARSIAANVLATGGWLWLLAVTAAADGIAGRARPRRGAARRLAGHHGRALVPQRLPAGRGHRRGRRLVIGFLAALAGRTPPRRPGRRGAFRRGRPGAGRRGLPAGRAEADRCAAGAALGTPGRRRMRCSPGWSARCWRSCSEPAPPAPVTAPAAPVPPQYTGSDARAPAVPATGRPEQTAPTRPPPTRTPRPRTADAGEVRRQGRHASAGPGGPEPLTIVARLRGRIQCLGLRRLSATGHRPGVHRFVGALELGVAAEHVAQRGRPVAPAAFSSRPHRRGLPDRAVAPGAAALLDDAEQPVAHAPGRRRSGPGPSAARGSSTSSTRSVTRISPSRGQSARRVDAPSGGGVEVLLGRR